MKNELNKYPFSVGNEVKIMVENIVKNYVDNDKMLTEKLKKLIKWNGYKE